MTAEPKDRSTPPSLSSLIKIREDLEIFVTGSTDCSTVCLRVLMNYICTDSCMNGNRHIVFIRFCEHAVIPVGWTFFKDEFSKRFTITKVIFKTIQITSLIILPVSAPIPKLPSSKAVCTSSEVFPKNAISKSWIPTEPFTAIAEITSCPIALFTRGESPHLMRCPPNMRMMGFLSMIALFA